MTSNPIGSALAIVRSMFFAGVLLAIVASPAAAQPTGEPGAPEGFTVSPAGPHYHPIHHAMFGPFYGSGCPAYGACGCDGATNLAQEASCQIRHLAAEDIPVTGYLFDGTAWSANNNVHQTSCTGPTCCAWNLGEDLIELLDAQNVRALLHFWGGCHNPEQYQRAMASLGTTLLGFYLDDGATDAELTLADVSMQSLEPGDWENVAKAYQDKGPKISVPGLSRLANAAFMGDLSFSFSGLKSAVSRVLAKSPYVPAPYAEFTGYAYKNKKSPDETTYHRRLHFGALQPVMANTPYANSDPWSRKYSAGLVASYRYWAWLHRELVPYFYSYAYGMFENPLSPVLHKGPNANSFLVGNEIYVPIVASKSTKLTIKLPPGNWIDYWDESRVYHGKLSRFPVPVGREPIFILEGAIIPLEVERSYTGHGTPESAGSLTVLVYPSGLSWFRYRRDDATPWVTFSANVVGEQLTVWTDSSPGEPMLYRIERQASAPQSVSLSSGTIRINQGGDPLAMLESEPSINASPASGWYFDAAAHRLIVKVVP